MGLMHRIVWVLGLAWLLAGCGGLPREYEVQEGDVLFQSLPKAPLVTAIEGITRSPYSHCGIVVKRAEGWHVLEAIGPVKETPLAEWIARGRGSRFTAYRLVAPLREKIPLILAAANAYRGRGYDMHYRFDNEAIYCSELIYVAAKDAAGVELGRVQRLGELDWQPFEEFIKSIEGYVPLDRAMITPAALAAAEELQPVYAQ